jgi:hypothetical protein
LHYKVLTCISIFPPDIQLLVNDVNAQMKGGTLLTQGELVEWFGVKGNGMISIPGFLAIVTQGSGSLLTALWEVLVPPINVMMSWHG